MPVSTTAKVNLWLAVSIALNIASAAALTQPSRVWFLRNLTSAGELLAYILAYIALACFWALTTIVALALYWYGYGRRAKA